jgi:cyclic pyranopterin phosphate synthase
MMHDSDWFTVVEIEVNSRCNRRCSYCPVSLPDRQPQQAMMSDETFLHFVKELRQVGYSSRLSYHHYNEPLLRLDLERLVAIVKSDLPKCSQVLYTNGDLLSNKRYEALRDAGIDHFIVTRHDGSSFPEREAQTILLPEDLILTNRGGLMATVAHLNSALEIPCYAPADMLVVTVEGDVLLCCDDADRTQVMGNILHQSLKEIWFSPRFSRIRELLKQGRRVEASPICAKCSNTEYCGPGENYQKHLS